MKFGVKVRLVHLMLLIAVIAVCMWYLTEYKKVRCVAVIDKYRVVKRESESLLHIKFHFTEPIELADRSMDFVINEFPQDHFPSTIKSGAQVVFRYQHEGTWLFEKENAMRKFWSSIMINEAGIASDINEKLFLQIPQDFGDQ